MKDTDFHELVELRKVDNGFVPVNDNALELLYASKPYTPIFVKVCTNRDLSMHRQFFLLLTFIYVRLPKHFKSAVPQDDFYNALKAMMGMAKVLYEFKEMPPLVKYESISFGNMSQQRFETFVRGVLDTVYSYLLPKLGCEHLIDEIENGFKSFIRKVEV